MSKREPLIKIKQTQKFKTLFVTLHQKCGIKPEKNTIEKNIPKWKKKLMNEIENYR